MVAMKKSTTAGARAGEQLTVRYPEFGKIVTERLDRLGYKGRNPEAGKRVGVGGEMIRRYREGFSMAEGEKLKKLSVLIGVPVDALFMADKGGKKGAAEPQRKRISPDEQEMLDEYRQLTPDIQKVARARIVELLEEFGAASKKNPFGKGTQ